MPLCQLVYFSENQINPQRGSLLSQLSGIQQASTRHNAAAGLTGALVFDDLWFVQVLEGPRQNVLQTFERLKDDERHARLTLVLLADIEMRSFGNWRMGLITRNTATLQAFAPYLRDGRLQPHTMLGRQLLNFIIDVSKAGLPRTPASTIV